MWRTTNRQAPEIEFDYRKMAIKVDTRGLAKLAGTLRFSDLEKLPRVSKTYLLQCGAGESARRSSSGPACASPTSPTCWDWCRARTTARFIASDRHYVDESMDTLRHPQVMLAWLMNDAPIPPRHGAPLRLVIPFRYGNRSVKAITEIVFATPGLPAPPSPA